MAFGSFQDILPEVSIKIEDTQIGDGTSDFIQSVQCELARDKSDLITMMIANPIKDAPGKQRTSELLWTKSLAFMPGNILEVFMSYGDNEPELVAAGIMRKWLPQFPKDGVPGLMIKAFDGSVQMMDGTDEVVATDARSFSDGMAISDMVIEVLGDYDIDDTDVETVFTEPAIPTVKKAGMNDYVFVKGLANLVGFEFFVDWDIEDRFWKAHWRKPKIDDGDPKTFVWGPDFEEGVGKSILHEFYPSFSVQGKSTDVQAFYFDRDTHTWEEVIYPAKKSDKKQKFKWKGDAATVEADLQALSNSETGRGLRISAGGTSVEVLPETGFRSADEALAFARAWWQKKQELLIQGTGSITGLPSLRPNQVHNLEGIEPLSGPWNMPEVIHKYEQGSGYVCEILARKIVP